MQTTGASSGGEVIVKIFNCEVISDAMKSPEILAALKPVNAPLPVLVFDKLFEQCLVQRMTARQALISSCSKRAPIPLSLSSSACSAWRNLHRYAAD